ncbi:dihydropteroate synthase [Amycolatopsis endophytica]|uniref:dihydropteroate synthase n=1 Tax=Amycolatopsis endophytica TaxID=860233 RepID=A0A853B9X4_9PSEU|nr:dihydropteroate synthase [Amycolatopsis endophytica]NYI91595.1 dihydropteroate synthase [Amycolatopsis endophytica]
MTARLDGTPVPAPALAGAGTGRPRVMGILNVSPDSFSDGGAHRGTAEAIRHGETMAAQGADWIDVGGESTRPGARRPSMATELARVLPVVRGLARRGIRVSVDTMRAEVARRAVDAGARMVNDVSGGLADPAMLPAVAGLGTPYVLTHWRSSQVPEHRSETYPDVAADVAAELHERARTAIGAGIEPQRIIVDPGIGFSKNPGQSWRLLGRIQAIRDLGFPVLVGASRKRLLTEVSGPDTSLARRDLATAVLSALLAANGVDLLRVHDVAGNLLALEVEQRLRGG